MHQLRWTVLFATVMGCAVSVVWLAIAQSTPTSSQSQLTPSKPETVKGFEDVIRARINSAPKEARQGEVSDSLFVPENTKESWLKVLRTLNLNPPSRPEGWKFANYSWLRWRGVLASRAGSIHRFRLLTMRATAYCPNGCCGSSHGRTATGRKAEYGIVAVDPRVIPLGTALYVDRYGFAIAADTGRKIKGYRIDLCFPTHREAMRFGTRSVRVLILR